MPVEQLLGGRRHSHPDEPVADDDPVGGEVAERDPVADPVHLVSESGGAELTGVDDSGCARAL